MSLELSSIIKLSPIKVVTDEIRGVTIYQCYSTTNDAPGYIISAIPNCHDIHLLIFELFRKKGSNLIMVVTDCLDQSIKNYAHHLGKGAPSDHLVMILIVYNTIKVDVPMPSVFSRRLFRALGCPVSECDVLVSSHPLYRKVLDFEWPIACCVFKRLFGIDPQSSLRYLSFRAMPLHEQIQILNDPILSHHLPHPSFHELYQVVPYHGYTFGSDCVQMSDVRDIYAIDSSRLCFERIVLILCDHFYGDGLFSLLPLEIVAYINHYVREEVVPVSHTLRCFSGSPSVKFTDDGFIFTLLNYSDVLMQDGKKDGDSLISAIHVLNSRSNYLLNNINLTEGIEFASHTSVYNKSLMEHSCHKFIMVFQIMQFKVKCKSKLCLSRFGQFISEYNNNPLRWDHSVIAFRIHDDCDYTEVPNGDIISPISVLHDIFEDTFLDDRCDRNCLRPIETMNFLSTIPMEDLVFEEYDIIDDEASFIQCTYKYRTNQSATHLFRTLTYQYLPDSDGDDDFYVDCDWCGYSHFA